MITFTFIAWPIALSLIYYRFKEIKYINYFFYSIIIIYSLMHYKTFLNVKDKIVSKDENLIFYKLKDLKDVGNVITNAETPLMFYIFQINPL